MSRIDLSQLITAEDKAAAKYAERLRGMKIEAYRRIVEICPEWKQRNLTAQATLLLEIGRANWTAEDQAAWDAGEALWNRIAAIRAASDVLENSDPIPADYKDDRHWP